MVVPIYNAELAPKTIRGILVSLNQLAITAGIMVSTTLILLLAANTTSSGQFSGELGCASSGGRLENIPGTTGSLGSHSSLGNVAIS